METQSLMYFREIASGKTYFDVAEDCHVSQSSVSKAIMRLEDDLGCKLFSRDRRAVSLTPAGQALLDTVNQLLPIMEEGRKRIAALGAKRPVSVAIMPQTNYMNLDLRIGSSDFVRLHPEIDLRLVSERYTDQTYEMINRGEVDMLVSLLFQVTRDYCDYEKAMENPMYALLPENHPKAGEKEIDFLELYHERVILRSYFVRKALQESCNRLGLEMMPGLTFLAGKPGEFTRINLLNRVVIGQGISFYFRNDLRELNLRHIAAIPVTNVPEFPVILARRKGRALNQWQRMVWDYLLEEIRTHPEW